MTDKLTEICNTKRGEVAARKPLASWAELDARAATQTAPRGFEAALRARAAGSAAAGAIRFMGRVPHAQVERYYALCDIMAYPRKRSRLTDLVTPLKPLEAMAQGKLVAASDVGGHRELMRDGITGTLFAPDDPGACAAALAGLLADRSRWAERVAAGRAHVEAAHDWAANARRYLDVYQMLTPLNLVNPTSEAA